MICRDGVGENDVPVFLQFCDCRLSVPAKNDEIQKAGLRGVGVIPRRPRTGFCCVHSEVAVSV